MLRQRHPRLQCAASDPARCRRVVSIEASTAPLAATGRAIERGSALAAEEDANVLGKVVRQKCASADAPRAATQKTCRFESSEFLNRSSCFRKARVFGDITRQREAAERLGVPMSHDTRARTETHASNPHQHVLKALRR
ncbi:hypothetical protein FVE85_2890 [Porphyridium purpureum]|uniref:Uncharacterized protein n=1 Tax=Porphyridium purpureum TaxID=35688 RepID=A0A5J4YT48_PORPP|nr:hypothetical protein FVE85_2890 [Porphyridium purpureum]|eukprot:POR1834..scf227_4